MVREAAEGKESRWRVQHESTGKVGRAGVGVVDGQVWVDVPRRKLEREAVA